MALQANQFIGSKISLTSKADVRYEGVLYALDLELATISLAKVKMYGTEDRSAERSVPSKDEVYEYIIFRGADIRSIDVIEPPKTAPQVSGGSAIDDPAILEVSHFSGASSSRGPFSSSTAFNNPFAFKSGGSNNAGGVLNNLLSGHSSPSKNSGNRRNAENDAGTQASGQNHQQQSSAYSGILNYMEFPPFTEELKKIACDWLFQNIVFREEEIMLKEAMISASVIRNVMGFSTGVKYFTMKWDSGTETKFGAFVVNLYSVQHRNQGLKKNGPYYTTLYWTPDGQDNYANYKIENGLLPTLDMQLDHMEVFVKKPTAAKTEP